MSKNFAKLKSYKTEKWNGNGRALSVAIPGEKPASRKPSRESVERTDASDGNFGRVHVIGDEWWTTFATYVPSSLVHLQSGTNSQWLTETSIDFRVTDGVPMYEFLLNELFRSKANPPAEVTITSQSSGLEETDGRLVELDQFRDPDNQYRFRIKEIRKLRDVSTPDSPSEEPWECLSKPESDDRKKALTVIIDNGGRWRTQGDMPAQQNKVKDDSISKILLVGDSLPAVEGEQFVSRGWRKLNHRDHRKNTLVMVSSTLLRREGAHISRQVSWEQTIIDTLNEFRYNKKLALWNRFHHIVIRFGKTGALYLYGDEEKKRGLLVYNPYSLDSFYSHVNETGHIQNKSALLSIGIIESLKQRKCAEPISSVICKGIRRGLARVNYRFEKGYLSKNWLHNQPCGETNPAPRNHRKELFPEIVSFEQSKMARGHSPGIRRNSPRSDATPPLNWCATRG